MMSPCLASPHLPCVIGRLYNVQDNVSARDAKWLYITSQLSPTAAASPTATASPIAASPTACFLYIMHRHDWSILCKCNVSNVRNLSYWYVTTSQTRLISPRHKAKQAVGWNHAWATKRGRASWKMVKWGKLDISFTRLVPNSPCLASSCLVAISERSAILRDI